MLVAPAPMCWYLGMGPWEVMKLRSLDDLRKGVVLTMGLVAL